MFFTVVLSSTVLFSTVSIESVSGINCYNCTGPLCETQPQKNITCDFSIKACFQGYGTLNRVRVFGRACASQFPGQDCVQTTCAVAAYIFPGLSNCTGSCCTWDLCNKNVSLLVTPTVAVSSVIIDQSTSIAEVSNENMTTSIKVTTTPAVETTTTSTTPTVISSARALSQKCKTKFLFAVLFFVSLTYGLVI